MKKILVLILLLTNIIFAFSLDEEIKDSYPKPEYDARLDVNSEARDWYEMADEDEAAASNIALVYFKNIKDYEKAEFWLKKALSINKGKVTLFNLGLLYKTIKKYDKAIFFYKKADELGDKDAIYNLAYLYEDLEEYKKAIEGYTKAIMKNDLRALKNLSRIYYHNLKDNVQAVKYMIALADKKYPKEKLIRFFKIKWKLDDETIKKGYEEQLKADDIPENLKYKGGL